MSPHLSLKVSRESFVVVTEKLHGQMNVSTGGALGGTKRLKFGTRGKLDMGDVMSTKSGASEVTGGHFILKQRSKKANSRFLNETSELKFGIGGMLTW